VDTLPSVHVFIQPQIRRMLGTHGVWQTQRQRQCQGYDGPLPKTLIHFFPSAVSGQ
jgi:hypothetical protein